jgi:hypothetical protein
VPAGDTATRSCLRFVEISLAGGAPTLLQDLTFGETAEYYYYSAVPFDQAGNLITVFNRSSKAEYVGVYAGGQLAGSSTKNTFQEPVLVKLGETAYTVSASPSCWGDYSGASADPAANSVRLAGEYAQVSLELCAGLRAVQGGFFVPRLRPGQLPDRAGR